MELSEAPDSLLIISSDCSLFLKDGFELLHNWLQWANLFWIAKLNWIAHSRTRRGGRGNCPPSFQDLSKIQVFRATRKYLGQTRIFWKAIWKIWVKSGILGQCQWSTAKNSYKFKWRPLSFFFREHLDFGIKIEKYEIDSQWRFFLDEIWFSSGNLRLFLSYP